MKRGWLTAGLLLTLPLPTLAQTPPRHARGGNPTGAGCGTHCGTERWAAKTLTDSGSAAVINTTPQQSSVRDLIAKQAPATLPTSGRIAPTENQQFAVEALLIGWKEEAGTKGDHDFHLVLAEPNDHTKTMIAEIPSPLCAGACASKMVNAFQAARQTLINELGPAPTTQSVVLLNPPRKVLVTGVGFFDFDHHQDGLAPNCIELHPVLKITVTSKEPGGSISLPSGITHTCGSASSTGGGRRRRPKGTH